MLEMKVTALAPWFGGKRTMAPKIVDVLGPHRAYVEPFCGSMAVLLAKPACSFELVNDLHGDLTNMAWVIQHPKHGPALYRRLRRTWFDERLFAHCKGVLEDHPVAETPDELDMHRAGDCAERAYCYFVMCWQGRSGMLGTANTNNCFTIRYTASGGNQATRFAAAVDSIPAWRQRLRKTTILRRDGLDLLERLADEKGQVIYCDPPYLVKNASYLHDFTQAQHAQLALLLSRFQKTRVVLSYYDATELEALYPGWHKIDCSRAKHLAVQGRRGAQSATAPEVLLVNHPVSLFSGD